MASTCIVWRANSALELRYVAKVTCKILSGGHLGGVPTHLKVIQPWTQRLKPEFCTNLFLASQRLDAVPDVVHAAAAPQRRWRRRRERRRPPQPAAFLLFLGGGRRACAVPPREQHRARRGCGGGDGGRLAVEPPASPEDDRRVEVAANQGGNSKALKRARKNTRKGAQK